jgi:hypothetical protein
MCRRFQPLRLAIGRFLVRLRRPPVPPSDAPSKVNPPVANLAGRWPDSESLLARRMLTIASPPTETTFKPPSP